MASIAAEIFQGLVIFVCYIFFQNSCADMNLSQLTSFYDGEPDASPPNAPVIIQQEDKEYRLRSSVRIRQSQSDASATQLNFSVPAITENILDLEVDDKSTHCKVWTSRSACIKLTGYYRLLVLNHSRRRSGVCSSKLVISLAQRELHPRRKHVS